MWQQRNVFQIKEQDIDKTPEEQLREVEMATHLRKNSK